MCVYKDTHTLRVLPIHFGRETVPSVTYSLMLVYSVLNVTKATFTYRYTNRSTNTNAAKNHLIILFGAGVHKNTDANTTSTKITWENVLPCYSYAYIMRLQLNPLIPKKICMGGLYSSALLISPKLYDSCVNTKA